MKAELFYPDVFNHKSTFKDGIIDLKQSFSSEPTIVSEEIKGKLLQALLLYDSIIVNGWDLPIIIHFFNGRDNAEYLAESGLLRLMNASDIFLGCKKEGHLYTIAGGTFIRGKFTSADEIDLNLQSFRGNATDYINISQSFFRNRLDVDTDSLIDVISGEILRDISNDSFREKHNIDSKEAFAIFPKDVEIINTQLEAYRRIYISEKANIDHIYSEGTLENVIKEKLLYGYGDKISKSDFNIEFQKLTKVVKVPDIIEIVKKGILTTSDVLKIRNSRNCIEFRKWLHSNASINLSDKANQDVVAAYIDSIGKRDIIDKMPVKILRFLTTSLLGIIPGLGVPVSLVDSFVIDMLRSWKPSVFIDEYKKRINHK